MVGCGTPQGAARFKFRRDKEYGPHGDTHLRAVKQFILLAVPAEVTPCGLSLLAVFRVAAVAAFYG
jgi:hypothetical protein